MPRNHAYVTDSQSARAITDYCKALAHELGLTLDDVRWGCALCPDHVQAPYNINLSITSPFDEYRKFWFNQERVFGYSSIAATKDEIEYEIRNDLESLKQVYAKV